MDSIGFKNFRRFVDFPSIDLGHISILVGGNNSGKSTIVKGLLLCMYNLLNMRINDRRRDEGENLFSSGGVYSPMFRFNPMDFFDVKVKTFARAINNKKVEEESIVERGITQIAQVYPTTITFTFSIDQFAFEFEVTGNRDEQLTYGDVASITIEDKQNGVRYIANYLEHRMGYEILNAKGVDDLDLLRSLYKEFKSLQAKSEEAQMSGDLEQISQLTSRFEKITSQINSICDRDQDSEGLTEAELKKLIKAHYRKNNPIAASYYMNLDVCLEVPNEPVVLNVISNIGNYTHVKPNPPIEGIDYDLNNNGEEHAVYEEYHHDLDQREALKLEVDKILKSYKAMQALLERVNVEYISAHAANQNTLYDTTNRNDYIAQTVHDFYNERIDKGSKQYIFITNWMREFGIGVDFKIGSIGGEAYTVDIVDADKSVVPLADKGMGSIQMMMLLLRLATILHRNRHSLWSTTIIIEEPEQNLHPKLQSRLADLFASIASRQRFKFVIETHSEYLIREAQVIVAETHYVDDEDLQEHNPFKIYYLPEDGSERYEMKFRTDGSFENDFGEGFLDEAEKLAFKIL